MAVNKVVINNETKLDLTADTVDAAHLAKGFTAHDMKGESIVGTMESGGAYTGLELGFDESNNLTLFKTHNLTRSYSDYSFEWVLPDNFNIDGIVEMINNGSNWYFAYFSGKDKINLNQQSGNPPSDFVDEVVLPDSLEEISGYWFSKAFVKKFVFGANLKRFYGHLLPWFINNNNIRTYCTYDFSRTLQVPVLNNSKSFGWSNSPIYQSSSYKSQTGPDYVQKIIVPDSLYDEWIAATNWRLYKNKIVKASEVTA